MSWHVREEIEINDLPALLNGIQGRISLLRDAIGSGKACGVVAVARWLLRCVYGSDMIAIEELFKFALRDIREKIKDGSVL